MTRRRWIADHWDQTTATLSGAQADHLIRVLRAQPGLRADVVAGDRVWLGEVVWLADLGSGEAAQVRFHLHAEIESEPAIPITLVMSVYKFDHMEWAIEKVTEIGVARIAPVIARRTDKHLAHAAMKRVERWRRIAHEASQQSRRSDVPEIFDPVKLADLVRTTSKLHRAVLAEQERSATLRGFLNPLLREESFEMPDLELAIGPEGGWADEELSLFAANGWRAVSLGPRVLRAETAAIAAMAVLVSMMGR
jgi:16S rRNA (uracil1498-N3)-methyltransferase